MPSTKNDSREELSTTAGAYLHDCTHERLREVGQVNVERYKSTTSHNRAGQRPYPSRLDRTLLA